MSVPKLDPNNRPWWGKIATKKYTLAAVGYTSAVALIASFVFGWLTRSCPNVMADKSITRVGEGKMLVLIGWIVLPPIWFWLEYFGIYRYQVGNFDDLDQFKYGQDVASKIWLAAITALTIFYFGKDIRV